MTYDGTPFKTPDGKNNEARIDMNDTLVGITYPHDAVHRDVIVQASNYATSISAARNYLIVTPAGFDAHMTFRIAASSGARVQFFEGPTTSAPGTPITAARLNRKSTEGIHTTVTVGPTVTDDGAPLQDFFTGGGTNPNNGSSAQHDDAEWLLPAGASYMLRVTPSASSTMSVELEWYEVAT